MSLHGLGWLFIIGSSLMLIHELRCWHNEVDRSEWFWHGMTQYDAPGYWKLLLPTIVFMYGVALTLTNC